MAIIIMERSKTIYTMVWVVTFHIRMALLKGFGRKEKPMAKVPA